MITERRIFLAHPKALEDSEVNRLCEVVHGLFEGKGLKNGSKIAATVTTGRDSVEQFRDGSKAGMNWPAWEAHVLGKLGGPFDREAPPRFHYFVVVPNYIVGKATAEMVQRALKQPWPQVFWFHEADNKLRAVRGVNVLDPHNFRSGWALVTS